MAKKRGTRREKRLERKAMQVEHARERARTAEQRKWWLVGIAVATLGGSLALHEVGVSRALIGMLLLVGSGVWLAVALGGLGGGVKPRDRSKSGNIDYGR